LAPQPLLLDGPLENLDIGIVSLLEQFQLLEVDIFELVDFLLMFVVDLVKDGFGLHEF
jgi:hypothetical protein